MAIIYKRIFTILINFLKFIKQFAFILIIVILIGFNILTLASATIYGALHGLLSSLPIYSLLDNSVLSKNSSLKHQLNAKTSSYNKLTKNNTDIKKNIEKTTKRMQERIARLTAINSTLNIQNTTLEKTTKKMQRRIGKLEDKNTNIRKNISGITQRMQHRVAKVATANFAAMPLEAIPIAGIGVIVASTGYEIYEACQTMKDLYKINVEINPYNVIDESDKVCGLKMPSVNGLKRTISW